MIFDTDIFIWLQRGNQKAARLVDTVGERFLSVQTYLELFQGARNKQQHQQTKSFLVEYSFKILPLTENIGHRAAVYIEEYALASGMRAGDAIVAATAVENALPLVTGNRRHFAPVKELILKVFRA